MNFKILVENHLVSFIDAINSGYISMNSKGIVAGDAVQMFISSGLFDKNNNEIFHKDVLWSDDGKRFLVEYLAGTFFIHDMDNLKGCIPMALSSFKSGNIVDMVIE